MLPLLLSLATVLFPAPQGGPKHVLRGLVKDEAGKPLAVPVTVRVAMRKDDGSYQQPETKSGADGTWSMELDDGWKVMELWGRARGRAQGHAYVERRVGLDTAPIELVVPAGATLRGVVVDKLTGHPVQGARVWAENWQWDELSDTPMTRVDESGHFELGGLTEIRTQDKDQKPTVRFDLHAEGGDHAALKNDAWSAERQADGTYTARLELVPNNCVVQGVVNYAANGEACEGALVAIIDDLGQYRVTTASAGGSFTLEHIGAGKAFLWAWPIALRPGETVPVAFGRDTFLVAGGQNAAVIWLEPVEGTEISGSFQPEANAKDLHPKVVVRRGLARDTMNVYFEEKEYELDAENRFRARNLLPGRYQVELRFAGDAALTLCDPQRREVDLDIGKNPAPIVLRCARAIELGGRVDAPGLDLRFSTVEYAAPGQEGWQTVPLESNGRFAARNLWPAAWRLRLRAAGVPGPELTAGPESRSDLVLKPKP